MLRDVKNCWPPNAIRVKTVPLAQWSERRSYVPKVTGSSPVWDMFNKIFRRTHCYSVRNSFFRR